jgi:hypothetical protein
MGLHIIACKINRRLANQLYIFTTIEEKNLVTVIQKLQLEEMH